MITPADEPTARPRGRRVARSARPFADPERLPGDRPHRSTVVLSRILDDLIPIPGTKHAVGAEALASFVPGIGSAAGTVMSGVVMTDAIRLRVPLPVLLRMLLNVGIDAVLGYIPYLGPVLDAAWRANRKNMRLLERSLVDEHKTKQSSTVYLLTAVAVTVAVYAALLLSAGFAIYLLFRWFLR